MSQPVTKQDVLDTAKGMLRQGTRRRHAGNVSGRLDDGTHLPHAVVGRRTRR